MLELRVIEVAIGLVLIYLMFSLLCSAINERSRDGSPSAETAGVQLGRDCEMFSGGPASCEFSTLTVFGLLLTIIALAQRAPFWFDTLNKLSNLRQTGKPPG